MTKPYLGEIDSLDEDDSDGGEHKDHGNDDDHNDDCVTMAMMIKTCRYLSCNAEEDSAMTSLACF